MTTTEIRPYEKVYLNPIEEFWNSFENFIIMYNPTLVDISDALFDIFCESFCKSMKLQTREYIRNYSYMIQRMRQQRERTSYS